jgi:hypothetical protein
MDWVLTSIMQVTIKARMALSLSGLLLQCMHVLLACHTLIVLLVIFKELIVTAVERAMAPLRSTYSCNIQVFSCNGILAIEVE